MSDDDKWEPVSWAESLLHERVEALRWIYFQIQMDIFSPDTEVHSVDSQECVMAVGHVPVLSHKLAVCGHARRSRRLLYEQLICVLRRDHVKDAVMRMTFGVAVGEVPTRHCYVLPFHGPNPKFHAARMWLRIFHLINMKITLVREKKRRVRAAARAKWKWLRKHMRRAVRIMQGSDRRKSFRELVEETLHAFCAPPVTSSVLGGGPSGEGTTSQHGPPQPPEGAVLFHHLCKHNTVIVFWASWDPTSVDFLRDVVFTHATRGEKSLQGRLEEALAGSGSAYPSIPASFFHPNDIAAVADDTPSDAFEESGEMTHRRKRTTSRRRSSQRTTPRTPIESPLPSPTNTTEPSHRKVNVVYVCVDTDTDAALHTLAGLQAAYEETFLAGHKKISKERQLAAAIDAYKRAPSPDTVSRLQHAEMEVTDIARMARSNAKGSLRPEIPVLDMFHVWAGAEGLNGDAPVEFGVTTLPHVTLISDDAVVQNAPLESKDKQQSVENGVFQAFRGEISDREQNIRIALPTELWHNMPATFRKSVTALFLDPKENKKGISASPLHFQASITQMFTRNVFANCMLNNGATVSRVHVSGVCFESQIAPFANTLAALRKTVVNYYEDIRVFSNAAPMPAPRKFVTKSRTTLTKARPRTERATDSVMCSSCECEINAHTCYYRCVICAEYDFILCEKCEKVADGTLHDPCHVFCKVHPDADISNFYWGLGNVKCVPITERYGAREFWPHPSGWHVGVYCSVCLAPVTGVRWHCMSECSFDMCDACEAQWLASAASTPHGHTHNRRHFFLKIPIPLAADDSVLQPTILSM